jgi:hypothetical protein
MLRFFAAPRLDLERDLRLCNHFLGGRGLSEWSAGVVEDG